MGQRWPTPTTLQGRRYDVEGRGRRGPAGPLPHGGRAGRAGEVDGGRTVVNRRRRPRASAGRWRSPAAFPDDLARFLRRGEHGRRGGAQGCKIGARGGLERQQRTAAMAAELLYWERARERGRVSQREGNEREGGIQVQLQGVASSAKASRRWQGRCPGNLHAGAPCLSEEDNHHFAHSPLHFGSFPGKNKPEQFLYILML
jgi:hypothetical protein